MVGAGRWGWGCRGRLGRAAKPLTCALKHAPTYGLRPTRPTPPPPHAQFDIPATYPTTAPEIELPELEGKTAKMYRGGKICLTIHFKPLWAKNSPHFGVAHALCLGLAPWLAAEVPFLVESGAVKPNS